MRLFSGVRRPVHDREHTRVVVILQNEVHISFEELDPWICFESSDEDNVPVLQIVRPEIARITHLEAAVRCDGNTRQRRRSFEVNDGGIPAARYLGTHYNEGSKDIYQGISQILNGTPANSVLPSIQSKLQRLLR